MNVTVRVLDGPAAGRYVDRALGPRWFWCVNPWYGRGHKRVGVYYVLSDEGYVMDTEAGVG